jgi:protein-tyrosine phosphatase
MLAPTIDGMGTAPFVIDWPAPGRLGIMPRPAGGQWLNGDLAALRESGVDTLVCALSEEERERLALTQQPTVARQLGLSYIGFPIPDFGVPDPEELRHLAARLAGEVCEGRFVVVHCFGGIGRSGVIAGATLIRLGANAEQAIELITQARGVPAPETDEQRDLLRAL